MANATITKTQQHNKMKLTKKANTQLKAGMTLIELTVVILVLLTLISVLFIGAQAYKNAADRSACILNIRNFHQGVRAYQNTDSAAVGSAITRSDIVGADKFVEVEPVCPTDATTVNYTLVATYPAVGTSAVTCTTNGSTSKDHQPKTTDGW